MASGEATAAGDARRDGRLEPDGEELAIAMSSSSIQQRFPHSQRRQQKNARASARQRVSASARRRAFRSKRASRKE
jgi:hypothetical protein